MPRVPRSRPASLLVRSGRSGGELGFGHAPSPALGWGGVGQRIEGRDHPVGRDPQALQLAVQVAALPIRSTAQRVAEVGDDDPKEITKAFLHRFAACFGEVASLIYSMMMSV